MKVLYINNYSQGTGYSQAGIDLILALDSVGVDVVPREISFGEANYPIPDRLRELESKKSYGADVCIQHTLPHFMQYNGRFKLNCGLFASETSNFRASGWAERLNTMDLALVINRQMVEASRQSGVNIPIEVIPHASNMARFERSIEPSPFLAKAKAENKFVFYTIGELVLRKNLHSLLKAYWLEFSQNEPVELVVKTSKPGFSSEQLHQEINRLCQQVSGGLKLRSGKLEELAPVNFITERLTDEGILRLHAAGDVFVQPSFGEAWSQPCYDSMAMGKTPIVTNGTGYIDYISDETGWLVNCHATPVFGMVETYADLYTGEEDWLSVDINHLRKCMRQAYEREDLRKRKARNGLMKAYEFSYESVGSALKKVLEYHVEEKSQKARKR